MLHRQLQEQLPHLLKATIHQQGVQFIMSEILIAAIESALACYTHGNADVSDRKRRRIIDSVSNMHDSAVSRLEFFHLLNHNTQHSKLHCLWKVRCSETTSRPYSMCASENVIYSITLCSLSLGRSPACTFAGAIPKLPATAVAAAWLSPVKIAHCRPIDSRLLIAEAASERGVSAMAMPPMSC